ncbi:polar amino acid transport system substrate-binding protein [Chitinivorax tropicus]|uniref:Polar amino acid transport system substrate-binding protein n=1 Tax=Chitinivorax tropicus TaxID=714531 RepID=A0A840MKJ2_9PROT|nr:transporter substrate-binding domain-containing protein [Chitinivorax tropicus]MBB5018025.1 polar amino acid transport system substrate-binding protein [Chitinivorax tropicus]
MLNRFFFAVAAGLLTMQAQADDLDKIQKKGEVLIGVRANSPPFSFLDKSQGTVSGYDIEFAQMIARRIGAKPVFKTVEPDDRIPSLKDGRVDLVVATFAKTHDREKQVDFSLGYFVTVQKIAAKTGKFRDIKQLNGIKICVANGTSTQSLVKENVPTAVQVVQDDYDLAFKALLAGNCEAVAGPASVLNGNISKQPASAGLAVAEVPLGIESFGIGMRKGEKRLQRMVNDALLESERSGEAVKIFERYFGKNSPAPQMRLFKIQE